MAAILHRQPLTIKQQVEELKNWHKQHQYNVGSKTIDKDNFTSKTNENTKISYVTNQSWESIPNSKVNFDDMPVKGTKSNFTTLVENNVGIVDSQPVVEITKPKEKDKPKFQFLKKGEGIARFNMGPPKIGKKIIPRKQSSSLKLIKEPTKFDVHSENQKSISKVVESQINEDIPTLKAPDLKLNFTWKSILSGGNPEDMLEKVISSNHLEMMDPNSSIDSSTASLMEKLLSIGKHRLSRDREELRVFEAVEQHMLDSSFCSTSSYVNKLMANAVMSTPDKEKTKNSQYQKQSRTQNLPSNQLPEQQILNTNEQCYPAKAMVHTLPNLSSNKSVANCEESSTKRSDLNEESESCRNKENNTENKTCHLGATWTTLKSNNNEENHTLVESNKEDFEQSLHVRFAEKVDYKSFVEKSQSIDSQSQREDNSIAEFDESHEWKEEDSSSCCSQCSNYESSAEYIRSFTPLEKQNETNQYGSHDRGKNPQERLFIGDLISNKNDTIDEQCSNNDLDNFPPLLLTKLKELDEEIQIFREENSKIKNLSESLEKERKQIQEEKRRVNLERKKLNKEIEEEQNKLKAQLEEDKQKLMKEKMTFEKYSKSLTKNSTREERKEIQGLREQLAEMKEELNKKESRWGAAQARVRNQVKVLEEDNKKLREEVEALRKQAKYWELFNQKKKGKPFNNTKLIHAISEHISNIVLDNENTEEKTSMNEGYFLKKSSAPKNSTITQSDLQSMYGIKVIRENSALPNSESTSNCNPNQEDISVKKLAPLALNDNSPCDVDFHNNMTNIPGSQAETLKGSHLQNGDRCQKPCLEEESSKVIKEVTDGSGNVEITFPNGNIKKINKITGSEKYIYINGDVEEITHDGTIKYYFSNSRIWQTTLPDGLEIFDFPDGKVEKRHTDGTIEILFSNNNKKITYPDGSQEITYTNGTRLKIEADKTQILTLPNGQKEIHTEEWKRREYPDGTMKTLYPDGTTETVYSNGRVRLKDKYGNLVMDSASPSY